MISAETLRPVELTASDIPRAADLSAETGWNQTAADWALFIEHGKVFGLMAQERLVASAAVLPYGTDFGWVSMVIVTAAWRRRGLARRLTEACIRALRSAGRAALLDATPEAACLYAALGFVSLCTMQRWAGTGRDRGTQEHTGIDPRRRDTDTFGANRGFLLADFLARPGAAVVARPGAFALLRRGRLATQIGPLVAETGASAQHVLHDAIDAASGPVIIDVLQAGTGLAPQLQAAGFVPRRDFLRMALDRDTLPGKPAALLAAAGPEFG